MCHADGTEKLMAESGTPEGDKEYVKMHGGLHALLPNRTGEIVTRMVQWLEKACAKS